MGGRGCVCQSVCMYVRFQVTFKERIPRGRGVEAEQSGQFPLFLESVVLHVEEAIHFSPGGRQWNSQRRQQQSRCHF